MMWAIGGLPTFAKFIRSGHTFQGCLLLLILMMVSTQKYALVWSIIPMYGVQHRWWQSLRNGQSPVSVCESVNMISARDASASENLEDAH